MSMLRIISRLFQAPVEKPGALCNTPFEEEVTDRIRLNDLTPTSPAPTASWVPNIQRRFRPSEYMKVPVPASPSPKTFAAIAQKIRRGDAKATIDGIEFIQHLPYGDHSALRQDVVAMSDKAPREARLLLRELFLRSTPVARATVVRAMIEVPALGNRRSLEDAFTMLMSSSTPEERRRNIYPALLSIIEAPPLPNQEARFMQGWLTTIMKGWMSEAPEVRESPRLAERTEKIFPGSLRKT
ncbi:MAG: hypothetical protein HY540_07810 [Deltaproteobacteria bacterium]|nr:hypothetical protein [Deltaproteobacteria bacterium]